MGVKSASKPKNLTESIYSNGKTPVSIRVQDHTTFVVDGKGRRKWRFRANTASVKIDTNVKPSGDMAKDKAMFAEWSMLVKRGINPRSLSTSENPMPIFREVAEDHIANGLGHINNAKNLAQFGSTLRNYAYPALGDMPVDQIKPRHIYECLKDIWYGNPEKGVKARQETANRTLGRIRAVLGRAIVLGHIDGINPAMYKGNLDVLLKHTRTTTSFAAIHYRDIPKLVAELHSKDSLSALAILWIAANVTRTGETLKATYDQIDSGVWSVPFQNTKTRKNFQVPLTSFSERLLEQVKKHYNGGEFLFPSPTKGFQPISDASLRKLQADLEIQGWTKHGMRATFKTWAEEQTDAKNAVIESCLAHVTQGVEKHYMRGDYLELRRELMEKWHKHLESEL